MRQLNMLAEISDPDLFDALDYNYIETEADVSEMLDRYHK